MTDYLKKLEDIIVKEQEENLDRKRYYEGYLNALSNIRYAIRRMLEEREKEDLIKKVEDGE